MSLDIRTSYLNFFLAASLGLAFWYRNIGPDRPLGGFLLALSIIFLLQYGIAGMFDPEVAGRLILATLAFSVFLLVLLTYFKVPDNILVLVLVFVGLLILLWGVVTASSDSIFYSNIFQWTINDQSMISSTLGVTIIGFLLLSLMVLALALQDYLLMIIILILPLGAILILSMTDSSLFGYYFILLVVLTLFIYYFTLFFQGSFSQELFNIARH